MLAARTVSGFVVCLLLASFVGEVFPAGAAETSPWGHTKRASDVPAEGAGWFRRLPVDTAVFGSGDTYTLTIDVERNIGTDGDTFVRLVRAALADTRGWIGELDVAFRVIPDGDPYLRISLASPETVDRLCRPLETRGKYSCWNGRRVLLNLWRWHAGAAPFRDLRDYRLYLINHEVGHALGQEHRECRRPGDWAPVMMQQTMGVGECEPNPWPRRMPSSPSP